MKKFILHLLVNILALYAAAYLVAGINIIAITPTDTFLVLLLAAVIFALCNMVVKPIIKILCLPLTWLTLGAFILVLNGAILYLVGFVVPNYRVETFAAAFLGALLISIINFAAHFLLHD